MTETPVWLKPEKLPERYERFDVTCKDCGKQLKVPKFYSPYFCRECRQAFREKKRQERIALNERIQNAVQKKEATA